ncbi:MAG: alpha/beta fold hydrolase BchO [Pseudomonadota bacterium]
MYCAPERPDWEREGRDWPNRSASRFVDAGGLSWHVQEMGEGATILLIHGTGAATHSWRDVTPLLADRFNVVAVDLPGHGFTSHPPFWQLGLGDMAAAVDALLTALGRAPEVVVGHSAGAAILAKMVIDDRLSPRLLVSLNGAFLPYGGAMGPIASPLAKALFMNPVMPRLFAWGTNRRGAERMITGVGSTIDPEGVELYTRLAKRPAHVGAALGMMASWDLASLKSQLPLVDVPVLLVVGEADEAVAPSEADVVAKLLPHVRIQRLPGLGHLAHEEAPDVVVEVIVDAIERLGSNP